MNPELRRTLWLEATPGRLVLVPLLLGLMLAAVTLVSGAGEGTSAAHLAAWAIALLWIPRLAAQSLLAELFANTWDTQRAGALTPWQMTWGKLAGSTAVGWYAIGLCLAAALLLRQGRLDQDAGWRDLVLVGLLAAPGALFTALLMAAGARRGTTLDGFAAQLGGLGFALGARWVAGLVFERGEPFWGAAAQPWMMPACLGALALLAIAGCWWRMAHALQAREGFWVWPLFLAFLAFLGGGAVPGSAPWPAGSFALLLPVAWVALLADPKPPVELRRWLAGRDLRATPAWAQAFVVLVGLALLLLAGPALWPAASDGPHPIRVEELDWQVAALPALSFLLRDAALFHLVAWGGLPGSGIVAALVYAVILYGLLPTIIGAAGGEAWLGLLLPIPGLPLWIGLASPLAQAMLLFVLARRRLIALTPAG